MLQWLVEYVTSLSGWAKIAVLLGLGIVGVGLVFGKSPAGLNGNERPSPGLFQASILMPAKGARVPEEFSVTGKVLNPIEGYRYWLISIDDYDIKFWPQQDLLLDGNGDFNGSVSWLMKRSEESDSATIAVLAVPKEGLKMLSDHFSLPKEQRPRYMLLENILGKGGGIILQKRGLTVVR